MGRISLLLLAGMLATPLEAAELAGVTMADQVTVDGATLELNGLGLRAATLLKVKVYVAGLYLEQKSSDPKQILEPKQTKQLRLHFVRNVDRADIVDAWTQGFEINAGGEQDIYRERLDRLNSWMTDVSKGDTMVFTYLPGQGVGVQVRGERKGVVPGGDFARVFWSIWLGPKPPNKGLKTGLLGKG